eukprot:5175192-Pleurochrysis_carterae.AAC.5
MRGAGAEERENERMGEWERSGERARARVKSRSKSDRVSTRSEKQGFAYQEGTECSLDSPMQHTMITDAPPVNASVTMISAGRHAPRRTDSLCELLVAVQRRFTASPSDDSARASSADQKSRPASSQRFHRVSTASSQRFRSVFTESSQRLHSVFTESSQRLHSVFTASSQRLHSVPTPHQSVRSYIAAHSERTRFASPKLPQSCHKA